MERSEETSTPSTSVWRESVDDCEEGGEEDVMGAVVKAFREAWSRASKRPEPEPMERTIREVWVWSWFELMDGVVVAVVVLGESGLGPASKGG